MTTDLRSRADAAEARAVRLADEADRIHARAELLRPVGLDDVRRALLRQSDRLSALSDDWMRAAVFLRGQL